MNLRFNEIPRPIPIMDGRPTNRAHREHAGTRAKCVHCGKYTYRFIGNRAVCSYCSEKYRAEDEAHWSPSMAI